MISEALPPVDKTVLGKSFQENRSGISRTARHIQLGILAFSDIILIAFCFSISLTLNGFDIYHRTFQVSCLSALLMVIFGVFNGAYDSESLVRYGVSVERGLRSLFYTVFIVLFIIFILQESERVSRLSLTVGYLASALAISGARILLVRYNRVNTGTSAERVLVLCDGWWPDTASYQSTKLVDFDVSMAADDPATLDRLGKLAKGMDRIVVACLPEKREAWADVLRSFDAQAELLDDRATKLGVIGASDLAGQRTFVVSAHPLKARERVAKRMFDLMFASAAIVVATPVMIAIAIAIMFEDGRPVLFRQSRVGQGNRSFAMYKFRSMSVAKADDQAIELTRRNDTRVTNVGRFIRRTSLDELPQLFNVILGQMSIVGPRPHPPMAKAGGMLYWQVDARYWQRHKLKPGLTGLAQVRGFRGATDHEHHLRERLRADLEYLMNWSIWHDCKIVFATIRVLIHPQAY